MSFETGTLSVIELPGHKQNSIVGRLQVIEQLWSPQLQRARDIFIYLPPAYETSARRYPVIYMHDGQNLFDKATSFSGEWGVDETMEALSETEGVEAIVVGIPNFDGKRQDECCPFPDAQGRGGGEGAAYLAFIAETVKPLVDSRYRTRPEREHTGILGSSMGGLISLYGFFGFPETFGFAGAMSPALWFADQTVYDFIGHTAAPPGRLYLDTGTDEDEDQLPDVQRMRNLLLEKGYRLGETLGYFEDEGADHSEAAWANRLHLAVRFLLSS